MCKIFIMAGIKHDVIDMNNYQTFVEEVAGNLVGYANKDGIGYAAISPDGKLFGERWLDTDDAFDYRGQPETRAKKMLDYIKPRFPKKEWGTFGKLSKKYSAIMVHTRYATSGKGFHNVHPFVDKDTQTALIHNGIVDYTKDDMIRSTCDSERILNKYLEHRVMENPASIQNAVSQINGYFAVGVMSRIDDKPIIDIFKCSMARLSAIYVPALQVMVYTTDADDVTKVCKAHKLGYETYDVADNSLLRLNPLTGEAITRADFTYKREWGTRLTDSDFREQFEKSSGTTLPSTNVVHKDFTGVKPTDFVKELDKTVDDIIDKNSMNETQANKDGWKLSSDHYTWHKVGK